MTSEESVAKTSTKSCWDLANLDEHHQPIGQEKFIKQKLLKQSTKEKQKPLIHKQHTDESETHENLPSKRASKLKRLPKQTEIKIQTSVDCVTPVTSAQPSYQNGSKLLSVSGSIRRKNLLSVSRHGINSSTGSSTSGFSSFGSRSEYRPKNTKTLDSSFDDPPIENHNEDDPLSIYRSESFKRAIEHSCRPLPIISFDKFSFAVEETQEKEPNKKSLKKFLSEQSVIDSSSRVTIYNNPENLFRFFGSETDPIEVFEELNTRNRYLSTLTEEESSNGNKHNNNSITAYSLNGSNNNHCQNLYMERTMTSLTDDDVFYEHPAAETQSRINIKR